MKRALAVSLVCLASCNTILNIEDANLDPTFTDAGPDGATGGGSACDQYCATVMKNCAAGTPQQQYVDAAVCQAMCKFVEPGLPGATNGNSLACRATYAARAATDPVTNCRAAGPYGFDHCGDPCVSFCLLDIALCGNGTGAPYVTENECRKACGNYKYVPGVGEITQTDGDTLNCRLYHLEAAYDANGKTMHCPHTAQQSLTCFAARDAGGG